MPINISEPFLGHRSVFLLWILYGGMPWFVPTQFFYFSSYHASRRRCHHWADSRDRSLENKIPHRNQRNRRKGLGIFQSSSKASCRCFTPKSDPTGAGLLRYVLFHRTRRPILRSYVCCLGERIGSLHQYRQVCSAPLLFRKQPNYILTVAARSSKVQT